MKDPAVASDRLGDRRRRRQHHDQQRPHLHCAQALQATRRHARPGDRAAADQPGQDPGHHPLYAGRAGHHHRRRGSRRPSISTRWATPIPASSITGRPCSSTRSRSIPGITDVATDQQNAGPLLDITIKREVASSYGILPFTIDNTLDDAFGQRIVSTMYTTLEPVPCRPGGQSEVPVLAGGARPASTSNPRPASRCRYRRWSTAWSRSRRSWSTTRASSRR